MASAPVSRSIPSADRARVENNLNTVPQQREAARNATVTEREYAAGVTCDALSKDRFVLTWWRAETTLLVQFPIDLIEQIVGRS